LETKVSTSHPEGAQKVIAPIVVGVDTRGRSTSAVVWAAEEADRTGIPLRLVSVHEGDSDREDPQSTHGLAVLARRLALSDVSYLAVSGNPTDVLLAEAGRASLLVVGRRGRSGAQRLMLGSTSLAVSGRSPVPVVVVPEPWIQPSLSSAPVVVGVTAPDLTNARLTKPLEQQGAGREAAVLAYAFERASRLRVPLLVVSAWEVPPLQSWSPADVAAWRERYAEALEGLVAAWRERYSDVEVVARVVAEAPGQAVVDASVVCQLIVVGRQLRRQLGRLTFGSTTGSVLDRANRPVAVVPVP
jgi:nucleotide-binding universal stress UspA family protein